MYTRYRNMGPPSSAASTGSSPRNWTWAPLPAARRRGSMEGCAPTGERGRRALRIVRGGERILIDCGEGTQRQLMRSVGLGRIDRILITHLHGDHYLGLPGLLKTLSLLGREEPLLLYGPEGVYDLLRDAE